ncbi:hypothetical protein R3P38DRAFT_2779963 [Favolaschia claudopus]|uniref:Uncharacterized protein n=1 Tax=Favolaschia claudopus TaxID=2862362 RepID=A0AAW0BAT6_9AGAR
MAREGAASNGTAWRSQPPNVDVAPSMRPLALTPPGPVKVHTRLPEITPPKADPPPDLTMEDCDDPSEKHRGRRRSETYACLPILPLLTDFGREREAICENLNKLISCSSPREYWDLIRSWTDSRAGPCGVTPSQLHLSFKKRSNPPDELPDYFDPRLHAIIAQLCRTIPPRTRDRTANGIFSRPVTEKDIGRMKKKLRSRAHRSACGIDDVSYAKILTIPNEVLVFLIETCVRDCDAPQRWLVTILAGFLKQGKPVDDPDGYRLVAKECCLLKLCTMVFEERLREWGDTNAHGEEAFKALLGLLTGDTASPGLWNFFFRDFRLPAAPADVQLNGRPVSQAEQADDNLIMSTLFADFQHKVQLFYDYTGYKRLFVSGPKSKWQIYGALPTPLPTLWLGNNAVELVPEFKYLGTWLSSTTGNIFAHDYVMKASKARNAANAAYALKHRVGAIPPKEGLQLYNARVDCYLISGADIWLLSISFGDLFNNF